MTEWLKEILGDAYTEEIDNKVSEKLTADYAPKSELLAAQTAQQTAAEAQQAAEKAAEEARFDSKVDVAIAQAHGRSIPAVRALLDIDKLRGSADPDKDIAAALETLKKESGYLFESQTAVPPVAAGTGSAAMMTKNNNDAALRAAFGLPSTAGKQ